MSARRLTTQDPADELPDLVYVKHFIEAVRDSGYKTPEYAVFELIDNAIEAGAERISVELIRRGSGATSEVVVAVVDDGCGMGRAAVRRALTFGGSTRFGSRESLGRYGMGLPSSSVSFARRVDLYSRVDGGDVWHSYLDVDLLANGEQTAIPTAKRADIPEDVMPDWFSSTSSGSVVIWTKCDRLEKTYLKSLSRRLRLSAGRVYRKFIWDGLELSINGETAVGIDPTFLRPPPGFPSATPFGKELLYEVRVPDGEVTTVSVRFSELPIAALSNLSNAEKQGVGLTRHAGVSVLRGGREIDQGWFFMGGKRRENYDDWWRCEISFEPAADELFGITHSKQVVRPTEELEQILAPDLETAARALNIRTRRTFEAMKRADLATDSEARAGAVHRSLPPIPEDSSIAQQALVAHLQDVEPALRPLIENWDAAHPYVVRVAELPSTLLFDFVAHDGKLLLVLNSRHNFVSDVYVPLLKAAGDDASARKGMELLLLAAARSEARVAARSRATAARMRREWSDTLATFLG